MWIILGVMDCDLSGLRVVVDCAGAAYEMALRIGGLGPSYSINDEPDGRNVSTADPQMWRSCAGGCGPWGPYGHRHDGDADRLIAVDEKAGGRWDAIAYFRPPYVTK